MSRIREKWSELKVVLKTIFRNTKWYKFILKILIVLILILPFMIYVPLKKLYYIIKKK